MEQEVTFPGNISASEGEMLSTPPLLMRIDNISASEPLSHPRNIPDIKQDTESDGKLNAVANSALAYQGFLERAFADDEATEETVPGPPLELFENGLSRIQELKEQLVQHVVPPYEETFEDDAAKDSLVMGSISIEEAEEQDRILSEQRRLLEERELKRMRMIIDKERAARERVSRQLNAQLQRHRQLEAQRLHENRERLYQQRQAFRQAEAQLKMVLAKRKADVKMHYGDLRFSHDKYGGIKARRYKLDWSKAPQPVRITLHLMRAVKDKLPKGNYCMLVTCCDQLAGYPLWWANLQGKGSFGASSPFLHGGRFDDVDLRIDQNIYTVCPSSSDMNPSMVFVFELYLMKGRHSPTDRVMAWGAFPIYNCSFEVVQGRFKCPMFRGEIDPDMDTHAKLERRCFQSLDKWLCNMYFEIATLSRYVKGQREYEIELQLSNELLGFGSEKERPSGDNDIPKSSDSNQIVESSDIVEEKGIDRVLPDPSDPSPSMLSKLSPSDNIIEMALAAGRRAAAASSAEENHGNKAITATDGKDNSDVRLRTGSILSMGAEGAGLTYIVHGDERQSWDKLSAKDTVDKKGKGRDNKDTECARGLGQAWRLDANVGEDLEGFRFDVKQMGNLKPRRRWQYIWREIGWELQQWRSPIFWLTLAVLLVVVWVRVYVHYLGEWVALRSQGSPVERFEFSLFHVYLAYPPPNVLTMTFVLSIVISGPLANFCLFLLLTLIAWSMTRLFKTTMDLWSRVVACYGVATVLDPVLIVLADLLYSNFSDGDSTKLYHWFALKEGDGILGVFFVIVLYGWLMGVSALLLFFYFLNVYQSGKLMDVYHRLNGDWNHFFVPADLEISARVLKSICEKAERWRGEGGARRKIAVKDFIATDDNIPSFQETTTELNIYTVNLDGSREPYRSFIRQPDGAVFEVFGSEKEEIHMNAGFLRGVAAFLQSAKKPKKS